MDLPKFLAVLEQGALYFPAISELPDKWEAVIDRRFSSSVASMVAPSISGSLISSFQQFNQTALVNCWYMGDVESIAMWTLYTSTDYGIAIKSNVGRLKKAFEAAPEHVYLGTVEYRDHEALSTSLYPPSEVNAVRTLLQKRVCYKHECELRALSFNQPPLPAHARLGQRVTVLVPIEGRPIKVHLAHLIESITLGPGFPHWAVGILSAALLRAGISPQISTSDAYRDPPGSVIQP